MKIGEVEIERRSRDMVIPTDDKIKLKAVQNKLNHEAALTGTDLDTTYQRYEKRLPELIGSINIQALVAFRVLACKYEIRSCSSNYGDDYNILSAGKANAYRCAA